MISAISQLSGDTYLEFFGSLKRRRGAEAPFRKAYQMPLVLVVIAKLYHYQPLTRSTINMNDSLWERTPVKADSVNYIKAVAV